MKAKKGFKLPHDGSEAVESLNTRKPRLFKPRKLMSQEQVLPVSRRKFLALTAGVAVAVELACTPNQSDRGNRIATPPTEEAKPQPSLNTIATAAPTVRTGISVQRFQREPETWVSTDLTASANIYHPLVKIRQSILPAWGLPGIDSIYLYVAPNYPLVGVFSVWETGSLTLKAPRTPLQNGGLAFQKITNPNSPFEVNNAQTFYPAPELAGDPDLQLESEIIRQKMSDVEQIKSQIAGKETQFIWVARPFDRIPSAFVFGQGLVLDNQGKPSSPSFLCARLSFLSDPNHPNPEPKAPTGNTA